MRTLLALVLALVSVLSPLLPAAVPVRARKAMVVSREANATDAGLAVAQERLRPLLAPLVAALTPEQLKDAKSALQEYCQARRLPLPEYVDAGTSGPDHARVFAVAVDAAGRRFGPCTASKKRDAEVEAARAALAALAELEADGADGA